MGNRGCNSEPLPSRLIILEMLQGRNARGPEAYIPSTLREERCDDEAGGRFQHRQK